MPTSDASLIADEGWFMANAGPLNIVYLEGAMSPASFEHYLATLARDIDDWPETATRSVFYCQARGTKPLDPTSRRALGKVLDARKDKLRRITRGYAFATQSAIARGILMAVFWLAPPPYPYAIVADPKAGFEWLAGRDDRLAPPAALQIYESLRRRYLLEFTSGLARG